MVDSPPYAHPLARLVEASKHRRVAISPHVTAVSAGTVGNGACECRTAPAKAAPAKPLAAKPYRPAVVKVARKRKPRKPVSRDVALGLLMAHPDAVELLTAVADADALLVLRGVSRKFKAAAAPRIDALVHREMAALRAVPASVREPLHAGFARDYVGFCVAGEAPPLERMLAHDCGHLVARALRLGVRAAVTGQPQAASGACRRQYDVVCYVSHYFVVERQLAGALSEPGDERLRARLLREWLSDRLAGTIKQRPSAWVDEALHANGIFARIRQRVASGLSY